MHNKPDHCIEVNLFNGVAIRTKFTCTTCRKLSATCETRNDAWVENLLSGTQGLVDSVN